jgi:hypothetical protein
MGRRVAKELKAGHHRRNRASPATPLRRTDHRHGAGEDAPRDAALSPLAPARFPTPASTPPSRMAANTRRFGTAASMNGYAASHRIGDARQWLQDQLSAHAPRGMFLDLKVSATAPHWLSAAGFGDSLVPAHCAGRVVGGAPPARHVLFAAFPIPLMWRRMRSCDDQDLAGLSCTTSSQRLSHRVLVLAASATTSPASRIMAPWANTRFRTGSTCSPAKCPSRLDARPAGRRRLAGARSPAHELLSLDKAAAHQSHADFEPISSRRYGEASAA